MPNARQFMTRAQQIAFEQKMKLEDGWLTGQTNDRRRVDRVHAELDAKLKKNKQYALFVVLALAIMSERVVAAGGPTDIVGALNLRPNETQKSLTLRYLNRTISIRGIYELVHAFVVKELQRGSAVWGPQQATETWADFRTEFAHLLAMSAAERATTVRETIELVLQTFEPTKTLGSVQQEPRPFTTLLNQFDIVSRDDRPGAMMQAVAYGYYRADAPSLSLESGRSREGGRRRARIGDIDGYSGRALALSVEVKAYKLDARVSSDIDRFRAALAVHRNTTSVVFAPTFDEQYRDELESLGLLAFDISEMERVVRLWDLPKQQQAVRGMWHFLHRIERNDAMQDRLETFLAEDFDLARLLG